MNEHCVVDKSQMLSAGIKRISIILMLGMSGLIVIAIGLLAVVAQVAVNRTHEPPDSRFDASAWDSDLSEGKQLARITGCIGCHGPNLEGREFMDERWLARVVVPDLTRVFQHHSDAEFDLVIRRGLRRDGRSVWVMPSPMYAHLSDEDLAAIINFSRSRPVSNGPGTVASGPRG